MIESLVWRDKKTQYPRVDSWGKKGAPSNTRQYKFINKGMWFVREGAGKALDDETLF